MSSHSRRLSARFHITTPMFLAGADPERRAEQPSDHRLLKGHYGSGGVH